MLQLQGCCLSPFEDRGSGYPFAILSRHHTATLKLQHFPVARFETVLHQNNAEVANMPPLPPRSPLSAALTFGAQKYTSIPVPALAIYACPHNWDRLPDNARKAALIADDKARCSAWADAFHHGVPSARIVSKHGCSVKDQDPCD